MEALSNYQTASLFDLVPNGYLAQVLPSSPGVEDLAAEVELEDSEQCGQGDLSPREESGQNKKKTKLNKIWNFVSRRKGVSSQGKRPQSMILLGDTSKSSELRPKVTLMDRMKSFKRLKPTMVASKNTAPKSSKAQENEGPSSSYHMRKAEETPKPFRHSYAGHIEGMEPFLEDAQRLVHTPNRVNQKVLPFKDSDIQMEDHPCEEDALEQTGSRGGRWTRSYLKHMFPADREAPHISARNLRIQKLEFNIEGSNLERNVEGGYEESLGHLRQHKTMPFGSVVKFFSNMAEVARKWRSFSREEPQASRQDGCEAYLVPGSEGFILQDAASSASFQLKLPCRPPDTELCGSVIERHQDCHLKVSQASQASCTFEMSIDGEKMSGQILDGPCTTATLAWASPSAAFELQDDHTTQKGYSCHCSGAFTREHSSSEELEEDTETVVSFLKEEDSAEESPKLGTYARPVTTEAVKEKLEVKRSQMEKQETSREPMGPSQGGYHQKSDPGIGAADTEREACTGVPRTQVFGGREGTVLVSQRSLKPSGNNTLLLDLKDVARGQPNKILLTVFIDW
ncbi:uncharacterized protein V5649_000531 [Rhynchonycteris naso]